MALAFIGDTEVCQKADAEMLIRFRTDLLIPHLGILFLHLLGRSS
jgi:hypothetical protein